MRVWIAYDSVAKPGFEKGWGFSCLVGLEGERILFDTGWDGNLLLANLKKLGVRSEGIKRVVISHAHWDHLGGLPQLGRDMELYVPQSFSERLKEELAARFDLHEVRGPQRVCEGVWTTGELGREVGEQSLVVRTKKGLVVVVGCSHPGVRRILAKASEFGRVWGLVGGMHGFRDYGALANLGLIVPSHCTVHKKEILERFTGVSVEGKAGLEIHL
ncbi:MAG: MBL fold metallo-hydrolase [Candidatus Hadarchaeales archaeon]